MSVGYTEYTIYAITTPIQHRAACFILDKPWRRNERDSVTQMISELYWLTLQHRRKCTRLTLLFKPVLH